MNYFVIPPIGQLHLADEGTAGYFVLAHLYVKNKAYRDFFKAKRDEGHFILLDNGAAEHSLVTPQVLLDCVKDLQPTEVVAPDVLYNGTRTEQNLILFINMLKEERLFEETDVFFVPQGESKEEWLRLYDNALLNPDVKTIGLSKITVPHLWRGASKDQEIMEARHECFDLLKKTNRLQKPLHLLGAGDPREFKYYRNHAIVRSTDSCFTLWAALNGIDWGKGDFTRIPTSEHYFDENLSHDQIAIGRRNCDFLKKMCE